jgi:DNA-binding NarL/FixJ family response regulator
MTGSSDEIRVYLADDHVIFREGVRSVLADDPGIRFVGQCGDGLTLVEEVKRIHPDVVILDIALPSLNGLDACREIRRRAEDTEVLMLTMRNDEQCIIDALENGASGYLLKDAPPDQLAEAVRSVAQGAIYLGWGIPKTVLQRLNREDRDPYKRLTTRERVVLQLIAEGKTNRQIGEELSISIKTVDTHRNRLMQKLDIHNQTELVKFALRKGIIRLD